MPERYDIPTATARGWLQFLAMDPMKVVIFVQPTGAVR